MNLFTLERVTQPELEPVTLAEIRRHVRAFDDITDDDVDLSALIVGAREWAEEYTGRALVDQGWRLTIYGRSGSAAGGDVVGGYPGPGPVQGAISGVWQWADGGSILLRRSPVIAITSFGSVDADGATTVIDPTGYELREADSKWPRIAALAGGSWATSDLRIEFRAGYTDLTGSPQQDMARVPARFKQAIKLWVEAHYDRDKDLMPILLETAERLIRPESIYSNFA